MGLALELQTMKKAAEMTDREVINAIASRDLRAKVRLIFNQWSGRIEQASLQRLGITPVEMKRMELQAAEQIMEEIWRSHQ